MDRIMFSAFLGERQKAFPSADGGLRFLPFIRKGRKGKKIPIIL